MPSMLEDELLKWKFKRGSQEALSRIYEKYIDLMLTLAMAMLNDSHAAEDVVQDVFVSFARSAAGFRLQGSLKAYLATAVANRARDRLRQADYQTIEYNVDVPGDTFSTEPPEGYTATNSPETAPDMPMGLAKAGCANLECSVVVGFALPEGSVIMGWQCRDTDSKASQAPAFENLTWGGPLPKVAVEPYGLRSVGTSAPVTYTGSHMASTQKSGQFTEWALYVPARAAASAKAASYDVLYHFNLDPQPNAGFGLRLSSPVPVSTAQDFDSWVGGALAEWSDAGATPETLTYQRVIDLAHRLRTGQ